jgi:hypothetical protein
MWLNRGIAPAILNTGIYVEVNDQLNVQAASPLDIYWI